MQKVRLEVVAGALTDHYIPSQELIRLSEPVFTQPSVASIAIAAHEVGHALQKADGYFALKWKAVLMPIARLASNAGLLGVLAGSLLGMTILVQLGTALFVAAMAIQILTLPIEFDASKRALRQLQNLGMVNETDVEGARSVLRAAAMTYVASTATSMAFMAVMAMQMLGRARIR